MCVCVCVCVRACTCVRESVHARACVRASVHAYVCSRASVRARARACLYVCVYTATTVTVVGETDVIPSQLSTCFLPDTAASGTKITLRELTWENIQKTFIRSDLCALSPTVPCYSQGGDSLVIVTLLCGQWRLSTPLWNRLVGLVVKASASRAEDPGFESPLESFPGSSHTGDLKIGIPVATLPGAWRYRVSAGTG